MRKKLQQRLRELAKIEVLATPVTNRIARIVMVAAIQAVTSGRAKIPTVPIAEQLTDLMLVAYARRMKRERAINLSFASEVRRASALVDLDRVGSGFRRLVGRRTHQATLYWEERINAALQQISTDQHTTRRSVIEMRRAVAEMGLAPNNPSLIETLTRTHSQFAFNAAQYQLNKNNPYIKGYLFAAVMDNRTTDECASLDGKQFAANDPVLQIIWPPNHYNCRSQMIELTDDQEWDEVPQALVESAVDEEFRFNPGELLD